MKNQSNNNYSNKKNKEMSEDSKDKNQYKIKESELFSDPNVVNCLFHKKKQDILKLLIEEEKTIYDIKKELKMNPGVVKRHIDGLLDAKMIIMTRITKNSMGMNLKYYRAICKKYIVHIEWEKEG